MGVVGLKTYQLGPWAEALRGTIAKARAIALTHRADDFLIAWFI
jgi:hypothetical protein